MLQIFNQENIPCEFGDLMQVWNDVKGTPETISITCEGKWITENSKGDVIVADLLVADQLTTTDIILKCMTDPKFRDELSWLFGEMFLKQSEEKRIEEHKKSFQETMERAIEYNRILRESNQGNYRPVYTYLMYDEASKLYKIGKSKNVEFRERTLAGQTPKIKTICSTAKDIEIELHQKWWKYQVRGEWFDIPSDKIQLLLQDYE